MADRTSAPRIPKPVTMPESFNQDPEEALHYLRLRQFRRRGGVAAARAVLEFFERWRPRASALPWLEQLMGILNGMESQSGRGPARNLGPLMEVKGFASGVYGSSLLEAGYETTADKLFSRVRRSFDPTAGFDIIQVTIDLQFWLIASGKADRAAMESPPIWHHLSSVTNKSQRDAITLWLVEVDQRLLSVAVAERVITDVRRLGKPKNLTSLICHSA